MDVVTDTSVSGTMFDQKRTSIQSKHVMRPLMRPDEVGSMNETHCIIKLRNLQAILGTRNLYYADRQLEKLTWLPVKKAVAIAEAPTKTIKAASIPLATFPQINPQAVQLVAQLKPGVRFDEMARPSSNSKIETSQVFAGPNSKPAQISYAALAAEIVPEVENDLIALNALNQMLPASAETANLIEEIRRASLAMFAK
jgi:hypothetical protein